MSKSTKIIAALGLAAGLGVASIPVATFALPSTEPYAVDGNVDLYVEIPTAIAMTIKGNNDDDSLYEEQGVTHVSNTASTGYNVNGINVYDGYATDDTQTPAAHADTGTVDGHQVTDTDATNHILNKTGSLRSSSYAFLDQNQFTVGTLDGTGTNGGFKSTIKVYTNNGTGYNLNASGVRPAASETAVAPDLTMTSGTNTYTIPAAAITGTQTGGVYTSGWGYKVVKYQAEGVNVDDEASGAAQVTDAAFSAMPAYNATTANTIDSLDSATSDGRETVVLYGVQTAPDQAAGVYKTTLLYTATTK
ncbi:hypothetical protein IKE84_00905 [Candidatus Saccharibacteria bacterium]|nr:hypothetical protein [Candidatus Saccharibacteria bacterium]